MFLHNSFFVKKVKRKMRKNGKIFLKELYVQQTDRRRALACVGSERFSGIRFVCLGFSVFLW